MTPGPVNRAPFLHGLLAGLSCALALGGGLWGAGFRLSRDEPLPVPCPCPCPASEEPPPADPAARRKLADRALQVGNDAVTAGDWDTAVRHAEKALALDGSLPEAHKMLGLSHWRRGDTCRGKRHFLQFVALAPGDPMVPRVERILAAEEMRLCP